MIKTHNQKVKDLTNKLPNDADLGRAIRKLVKEEDCCNNPKNWRKSGENRMICQICGNKINN